MVLSTHHVLWIRRLQLAWQHSPLWVANNKRVNLVVPPAFVPLHNTTRHVEVYHILLAKVYIYIYNGPCASDTKLDSVKAWCPRRQDKPSMPRESRLLCERSGARTLEFP